MNELTTLVGLMEGLTRLARTQIDLQKATLATVRVGVAEEKRAAQVTRRELPAMGRALGNLVRLTSQVHRSMEVGLSAVVRAVNLGAERADRRLATAPVVLPQLLESAFDPYVGTFSDGFRAVSRELRPLSRIEAHTSRLVYLVDDIYGLLRRLHLRLAAIHQELRGGFRALQRGLSDLLFALVLAANDLENRLHSLEATVYLGIEDLRVSMEAGLGLLSAWLAAILNHMRVWGLEGIYRMLSAVSSLTNIPIADLLTMIVTKLFEGVLERVQAMTDQIVAAIEKLGEALKECCKGGGGGEDPPDDDKPWWQKLLEKIWEDWDKFWADPMGYLWEWLKDKIWDWAKGKLWDWLSGLIVALLPPWLKIPFMLLKGTLGKVFGWLVDKLWDGLSALGGWIWDGLSSVGEWAWEGIKGIGESIWGGLSSFGSWIWDGISSFGAWAWDGITSFGATVWESISGFADTVWDGVSTFASSVWDGLTSAGEWAWNAITDPFGSVQEQAEEMAKQRAVLDTPSRGAYHGIGGTARTSAGWGVAGGGGNGFDPLAWMNQTSATPGRIGGIAQVAQDNTFHTQVQFNLPTGTSEEQAREVAERMREMFRNEWTRELRTAGENLQDAYGNPFGGGSSGGGGASGKW